MSESDVLLNRPSALTSSLSVTMTHDRQESESCSSSRFLSVWGICLNKWCLFLLREDSPDRTAGLRRTYDCTSTLCLNWRSQYASCLTWIWGQCILNDFTCMSSITKYKYNVPSWQKQLSRNDSKASDVKLKNKRIQSMKVPGRPGRLSLTGLSVSVKIF